MNKKQIKPSLGEDTINRLKAIASRYEESEAAIAAMALTELSYIRPECWYAAIGSIPEDMKRKPVGRPIGSTARNRETIESEPLRRATG